MKGNRAGSRSTGSTATTTWPTATALPSSPRRPKSTLPDIQNEPPSEIKGTSLDAQCLGQPDGVADDECVFEYGTLVEYGYIYYEEEAPCEQGQAISGSSATPVSATLTGLNQGGDLPHPPLGRQRQRNRSHQGAGRDSLGKGGRRRPLHHRRPLRQRPLPFRNHTRKAPPTTYHVLYGTGDCTTEPETCDETPESPSVGAGLVSIARINEKRPA